MGEDQGTLFEPEFNRSVKVQTSEQRITSHANAVLLREADHQLGLVKSLAAQHRDPLPHAYPTKKSAPQKSRRANKSFRPAVIRKT